MSRRKPQLKSNDDFVYYFETKKKPKAPSRVKHLDMVADELVNVEDDDGGIEQSVETTSSNENIDDEEDEESMVDVESEDSAESESEFASHHTTLAKQRGRPACKTKKKNPDTGTISSDEEKWLDAIEEGRLEEDKVLKRMKDPKTMTARQKAKVERVVDTSLDFSTDKTSKPILTEEQMERKAAKARERKKVADVKKEEEKKRTIEKLLLKRDDKTEPKKKLGRPGRPKAFFDTDKPWVASYSLHLTPVGKFVSSPPGLDFPMEKQTERVPPAPVYCGAPGCQNLKKYSCSKTQVPLCSLDCYRANIKAVLGGETAIS